MQKSPPFGWPIGKLEASLCVQSRELALPGAEMEGDGLRCFACGKQNPPNAAVAPVVNAHSWEGGREAWLCLNTGWHTENEIH